MSLVTFEETRPFATAIKNRVATPAGLRSAPVTFTASGIVGDPGPPGGGAGGGGGGQPSSLAKPKLTKLKLSPAALRRGKRTTISWTDSAAATVTLTVARKASGVRRGRSCVAPPRKATKKAKRCTRWIAVKGSLSHRDAPGANRLSWNGRLRGRALAAGGYRLTATPKLGTVAGAPATKAFTIRR